MIAIKSTGLFVILLLLVALCATLIPPDAPTISPAPPVDPRYLEASDEEIQFGWQVINAVAAPQVEITSYHATNLHKEAEYVRQTCRDNGVYQIWREKHDTSVFHLLCQDKQGNFVDWIVRVVDNGRRIVEKTAFKPKDGTWNEVTKWLYKNATRYKKGIP